MGLIDHFMLPEVRPFAVSAMMLAIVGGIEAVSLIIGFSLGELLGSAIDFQPGGKEGGFLHALSWLNVGRVPILVCICLALGIFSIAGFLIQDAARLVAGPLPAMIAAPVAGIAAVPLLRASTRLAARLIPEDETYAVDLSDLVGRVGEVSVGPLDQGLPGRVRVKDIHGNWHIVTASAAPDSPPLQKGTDVLLVDRKERHFIAVAAADELEASHHRRS
jgi:hypothetical protein